MLLSEEVLERLQGSHLPGILHPQECSPCGGPDFFSSVFPYDHGTWQTWEENTLGSIGVHFRASNENQLCVRVLVLTMGRVLGVCEGTDNNGEIKDQLVCLPAKPLGPFISSRLFYGGMLGLGRLCCKTVVFPREQPGARQEENKMNEHFLIAYFVPALV